MCHEPIVDISKLPGNLQGQVYRPGDGEIYNITSVRETPKKHWVEEDENPEVEIDIKE